MTSRQALTFCAFFAAAIAGMLRAQEAIAASPSIDAYVRKAADRDGVQLTNSINDDLFLRRVTLDLVGRIPTLEEQDAFRASPNRTAVVDRLLASKQHAQFMSRAWTAMLVGYGQVQQADRETLRAWLQESFEDDRPLNDVVYDLVASEGRAAFDGPANFMLRHIQDPVVPVGRLFLGVQLDCARCHDHPTDRWTQDDFEGMQRFFQLARVSQPSRGTYQVSDRVPPSDAQLPQFLTGSKPRTGRWRQELALQIVTSKPFARTMVNRLWYHFFGRGISDPPDAVNGDDRPQDFAFISSLAWEFKSKGFRPRSLIREICISDAYAREVSAAHPDWTLMPTTKPMTPDQLFDSMLLALDFARSPPSQDDSNAMFSRREQFTRLAAGVSIDDTFGEMWNTQERVQSLMSRLNMRLPSRQLSHREIFRRILSRQPTADQLRLASGHTTKDLMFALVHSNEFYYWH